MYNIQLESYVPEPRPVTSDYLVCAHYYAAWKKGAAKLHDGFNDLAGDYPERTPLMGYYDEENPEVFDWEIKWASEHGINCFIHCWYRNLENMGKPITVNDLRCGHGLHEAMFNAKFQKYMKFAIMYEASPRWGGTDEKDMLEHLMPFWMETYFKRGNYLLIDNKPVLFVFNQARLAQECFRSAESQKATFDACREYARKEGFDGMIFAANIFGPADRAVLDDHLARGYDFLFGYTSGYSATVDYPPEEEIMEQQLKFFTDRLAVDPMRYIPTSSCFWDSTPRYSQRWQNLGYHFERSHIWYLSPENYRKVLHSMKAAADALPDGAWGKRIFMIDNWNEWDEGHFVAPSHQFGFKFLEAIRAELTACDNLPDYRMPQDMGFTGYNKSWITPDFGPLCAKRLAEKK